MGGTGGARGGPALHRTNERVKTASHQHQQSDHPQAFFSEPQDLPTVSTSRRSPEAFSTSRRKAVNVYDDVQQLDEDSWTSPERWERMVMGAIQAEEAAKAWQVQAEETGWEMEALLLALSPVSPVATPAKQPASPQLDEQFLHTWSSWASRKELTSPAVESPSPPSMEPHTPPRLPDRERRTLRTQEKAPQPNPTDAAGEAPGSGEGRQPDQEGSPTKEGRELEPEPEQSCTTCGISDPAGDTGGVTCEERLDAQRKGHDQAMRMERIAAVRERDAAVAAALAEADADKVEAVAELEEVILEARRTLPDLRTVMQTHSEEIAEFEAAVRTAKAGERIAKDAHAAARSELSQLQGELKVSLKDSEQARTDFEEEASALRDAHGALLSQLASQKRRQSRIEEELSEEINAHAEAVAANEKTQRKCDDLERFQQQTQAKLSAAVSEADGKADTFASARAQLRLVYDENAALLEAKDHQIDQLDQVHAFTHKAQLSLKQEHSASWQKMRVANAEAVSAAQQQSSELAVARAMAAMQKLLKNNVAARKSAQESLSALEVEKDQMQLSYERKIAAASAESSEQLEAAAAREQELDTSLTAATAKMDAIAAAKVILMQQSMTKEAVELMSFELEEAQAATQEAATALHEARVALHVKDLQLANQQASSSSQHDAIQADLAEESRRLAAAHAAHEVARQEHEELDASFAQLKKSHAEKRAGLTSSHEEALAAAFAQSSNKLEAAAAREKAALAESSSKLEAADTREKAAISDLAAAAAAHEDKFEAAAAREKVALLEVAAAVAAHKETLREYDETADQRREHLNRKILARMSRNSMLSAFSAWAQEISEVKLEALSAAAAEQKRWALEEAKQAQMAAAQMKDELESARKAQLESVKKAQLATWIFWLVGLLTVVAGVMVAATAPRERGIWLPPCEAEVVVVLQAASALEQPLPPAPEVAHLDPPAPAMDNAHIPAVEQEQLLVDDEDEDDDTPPVVVEFTAEPEAAAASVLEEPLPIPSDTAYEVPRPDGDHARIPEVEQERDQNVEPERDLDDEEEEEDEDEDDTSPVVMNLTPTEPTAVAQSLAHDHLTDAGCTCVAITHDHTHRSTLGLLDQGDSVVHTWVGCGEAGWCDVMEGCAGAKEPDPVNAYPGWDTCTPWAHADTS